jgi:hypothetical protein
MVEEGTDENRVRGRIRVLQRQRVAAAERDPTSGALGWAVQEQVDADDELGKARVVIEHSAIADAEQTTRANKLSIARPCGSAGTYPKANEMGIALISTKGPRIDGDARRILLNRLARRAHFADEYQGA